jgi:hypothetical protein
MDAATLLAGALAGGADRLSPRDCWLCLAYLYSTGNSAQIQIDAAIAAGCDRLSDGDIEKCLAYMLTSGSSPVPGPVNLIPAGAVYDVWGRYYLQGTDGNNPNSTLLNYGSSYVLTWGQNEFSAHDMSAGGAYYSPASGRPGAQPSVQFTYSGVGELGFYLTSTIPGALVTATLVQV